MKQYPSNTTIYIYYLDWQHVLTSEGHHQAFIVNQLMFRELHTFLGSFGSQECMYTETNCSHCFVSESLCWAPPRCPDQEAQLLVTCLALEKSSNVFRNY